MAFLGALWLWSLGFSGEQKYYRVLAFLGTIGLWRFGFSGSNSIMEFWLLYGQ